MTDTSMALEINCSTGETIYRPLTEEELAQREVDAADYAAYQAALQESLETSAALKASAKAKLVAGQPLTEEEASVLVI
jgi:hypothetical protein